MNKEYIPKLKYGIDYTLDEEGWQYILNFMTKEKSDFVKKLRCDRDDEYGVCTWRSVARICNEEWHGDWGSNQQMGMSLCEAAARYFGEDYMKEPWN